MIDWRKHHERQVPLWRSGDAWITSPSSNSQTTLRCSMKPGTLANQNWHFWAAFVAQRCESCCPKVQDSPISLENLSKKHLSSFLKHMYTPQNHTNQHLKTMDGKTSTYQNTSNIVSCWKWHVVFQKHFLHSAQHFLKFTLPNIWVTPFSFCHQRHGTFMVSMVFFASRASRSNNSLESSLLLAVAPTWKTHPNTKRRLFWGVSWLSFFLGVFWEYKNR